jgi:hypothetical protein
MYAALVTGGCVKVPKVVIPDLFLSTGLTVSLDWRRTRCRVSECINEAEPIRQLSLHYISGCTNVA